MDDNPHSSLLYSTQDLILKLYLILHCLVSVSWSMIESYNYSIEQKERDLSDNNSQLDSIFSLWSHQNLISSGQE